MANNNYGNPTVIIQEFASGAVIGGVAPDGVATPDVDTKGRILRYPACTVGGEFIAPVQWGMALEQILVKAPGATNVKILVEDVNTGITFCALDSSLSPTLLVNDFVWAFRRLFLLPNWKLRVEATGALTADGEIAIWQGRGWEITPFSLVSI